MPKVFVFGLDGATFELIKPWCAEGKLPNFARLLEEGVSADLESVPSMRSPAAWTSMMTGKNPGKHGLYEFYEPSSPGAYDVRFVNGGMRRTKSIWQILTEQNKRVVAVNVPMTYPAEKVNGYMLSGLDAPSPESAGFCHPPELMSELTREFGNYILEPGLTGCIVGGRPDLAVQRLREELAQKERVTRYLMDKQPWDVFMVVFRSLDAVQHCFWKYMDPTHPHHDPAEAKRFGSTILEAYQQLDQSLGAIRASLDDDTVLMVMSDHGFGPKHVGNSQLNYWLAHQGWLQFKSKQTGDAETPWGLNLLGNLYRQVISRTPRSFKQKLAKFLPGLRDRLQTRLIYSNIRWAQTSAFADTLFASIRLNVRGREPLGIVDPGDEYSRLVDAIRSALMECRDAETGEKIVEAVFLRDELYNGPYVDLAPDLLIRWKEGVPIHGLELPTEVAAAAANARPLIPGEDPSIISGDHNLNGVFLLAGPGVKKGVELDSARLIDLTPTILSLLECPLPDDMDGGVLQDAFQQELKFEMQSPTASAPEDLAASSYSTEDETAIQQRLRDLGYIE